MHSQDRILAPCCLPLIGNGDLDVAVGDHGESDLGDCPGKGPAAELLLLELGDLLHVCQHFVGVQDA